MLSPGEEGKDAKMLKNDIGIYRQELHLLVSFLFTCNELYRDGR